MYVGNSEGKWPLRKPRRIMEDVKKAERNRTGSCEVDSTHNRTQWWVVSTAKKLRISYKAENF
jgi:hypothetical protein